MNSKKHQWLDELTRDSGWRGVGYGTVVTLFGAFMAYPAFLFAGPILIVVAAILGVVGWFRNR